MTVTDGNKKILDLKRWDFCSPAPVTSAGGVNLEIVNCAEQLGLFATSSAAYIYSANEDAYVQTPNHTLAGGFGAGTTVIGIPWSTGATVGAASLTATAGTTTSLTTNQNLAIDLRGYQIQLLEGPSAGDIRTIARNSIGANAVITVTSAFSATPTTSTTYRLLTPRWMVVNAGTQAAGSVKVYDLATNTWTGVSQTNLPSTIGTGGAGVCTSGYGRLTFNPFATGTSSGSNTATTLNNSTKNWTTNQWTNMQVRITQGTGAGQIRSISSNTATAITVSSSWTTTPDATSTYAIEGNDDHIYWTGNAGAVLYRYVISANTWSTIGTGRPASAGGGVSLHYANKVTDSIWTAEDAIINGRRLYSWLGGAQNILHYYDIPSGNWTTVTYAPQNENVGSGSGFVYTGNYIYTQLTGTGRWIRLDLVKNFTEPWGVTTYTQGTAVTGNRAWLVEFVDGPTTIQYVYFWLNSSQVVLRQMVI